MSTGLKYLNVTAKRLLGTQDLGQRFLEYMQAKNLEITRTQFDAKYFHLGGVNMSSGGNDKYTTTKANVDVRGHDGLGNILDLANTTFASIFFENQITIDYYIAIKYCSLSDEIQINPRTGQPEYVATQDQIGESADPDSVVDNGNGTITLVVDSVAESAVNNAGRIVKVYKKLPDKNATTTAIAIEDCAVSYVGSQNRITTTGSLGQTAISTTASDYTVVCLGPTTKRNTDLRTQTGYTFIGIVTGTGAGNPPTVFDVSDQRIVPYSLTTAIVDGLPQDFIPSIDNTYSLGSVTKRWANVYTANLSFVGDFLPGIDATQDLGSLALRWQNIFVSDTAIIDNLTQTTNLRVSDLAGEGVVNHLSPSVDNTYDLGNSSHKWRKIFVHDSSGAGWEGNLVPTAHGTYSLGRSSRKWRKIFVSDSFGDGWESNFLPTADDAYDLGGASYQWKDLYLNVLRARGIILSAAAGEGFTSSIVPSISELYQIGNSSYKWEKIFVSDTIGDGWEGNLVPTNSATYQLGSSSYKWKRLHISSFAGDGIDDHLVPSATKALTLGNTDYKWKNLYLSSDVDDGVTGHLIPSTDDMYDLGGPTQTWRNLYLTEFAEMKTLRLGVGLSEGVYTDLLPAGGTQKVGSLARPFNSGSFRTLNYTTLFQTSFDNYDDLGLIEAYGPNGETKQIEKAGEYRTVQIADRENIPWPMLSGKDPNTGNYYIDAGDAIMFLTGAIKQLSLRQKSDTKKMQETISSLQSKIKAQ